MLEILLWVCIFIISITFLVKASDYFTDAAEKIGLWLGLSPFIIGVTIVAIGTSLPELFSSFMAVLAGSSEIVIGNVVGSNIANILLILGITAIIGKKLEIAHELIRVDLPLLVGSSFLLAFMVWDGSLVWYESLLLLALLVVYLSYTFASEKRSDKEIKKEFKSEQKELKSDLRREKTPWPSIIMLVLSGLFIFIGAKYTVTSVLHLADLIGIGTDVIALSAVALGTSLPELSVTIAAARKKKSEMAIGNILGSNIFNTLAVMGLPGLIAPLIIPSSVLLFALPVMLAATFLYLFMTQDKQLTKWEGWLLVIFYTFFLIKVVGF